MAHQLVEAMAGLGHRVEPILNARTYMRQPDPEALIWHLCEAQARRDALLAEWRRDGTAPELWFTYHSYYKAPDLLGPQLSQQLGIPYIIAEGSDSERRAAGEWAEHVALARRSFGLADLHVYFTARDRQSVEPWRGPHAPLLWLPPFIRSVPPAAARTSGTGSPRLLTIAMMRPGKLGSYRALAAALTPLLDEPWSLTIIGDGQMRAEVEAAFAGIPADRLRWLGAIGHEAVKAELATHDVFFWPGVREAYGLVYLEAQATGLAVLAFDSGGVSATVKAGETALLVPDGDMPALTAALARLLKEPGLRQRMGEAARGFVATERTLERATGTIATALELAVSSHAARMAS
ncbi:glycosyltransferase family 4 protein [Bosea caraganae]|nr:glycosyltransferase family 4 protein [Bosea caraganae]